jgi:hypothetical protein
MFVPRLQEAARRSFDSDARRSLQVAARSSRMPGMRRNRHTGPTADQASVCDHTISGTGHCPDLTDLPCEH